MVKQQAFVQKKIELLPIDNPQNKAYTDKLLRILDRRIRNDPVLFVLYNNGRIVQIGQSDRGVSRMRTQVLANKKRRSWDTFAIYTIANRAYLNDAEALATRIAMHEKIGYKNFTRAKNTTEDVKKDIMKWANAEIRTASRSLSPIERKYNRAMLRLDSREKSIRKSYLKRIEKAKDKNRQNRLRAEREKRIEALRILRKKLAPLRQNIATWQAKIRSFQNIRL
jgi:hypothetical protein